MTTTLYFFFFQATGPPPVSPALSVAPSSLTFMTTVGVNPPSQNVAITNSGTGVLTWSRSVAGAFISAVPGSGTAPSTLTVSINVSGLLAGIYTGSITVTAPGATGSPAVIPVTLIVGALVPTLGVNPLTLNFTAQIGTNPAPQDITILNLGGGSFGWVATPAGTGISVAPGSGTTPGLTTVSIDTTGLGVGLHTGTVTVSCV